jgi:hypothetical protein
MTRRHRSVPFGVLFLGSLLSASAVERAGFRVDEEGARLRLTDGGLELSLPVENRSAREIPATLRAKLIDRTGKLLAEGEAAVELRRGTSAVEVRLTPSSSWDPARLVEPSFDRIEYQLSSRRGPKASASGVFASSWILDYAFDLALVQADIALDGKSHPVTVLATVEGSDEPVPGVALRGELRLPENEEPTRVSAVTDAQGMARMVFPVDHRGPPVDASVSVVGVKNGVTREVRVDRLWVGSFIELLLTTDKPLYQPSQTIHMRVLARDRARGAVSGEAIRLTVDGPEALRVFSRTLTTSRFGIASADWVIPEGARLGDYSIEARVESDRFEGEGFAEVRVSRYELPAFTVSVLPSAAFYLPGEDAEVTVRADYVYGKSVPTGRVRITRYGEEEPLKEGELDSEGVWTAVLDLRDAHERVYGADRFEDLDLVAQVTDPSSDRTEERRFPIRVTREPIHVYLIEPGVRSSEDGPLRFHVSTFTADGSAIACDVEVEPDVEGPAWRRRVRTNAYGVAEIRTPPMPEAAGGRVVLTAGAADGRTGSWSESLYLDDGPRAEIEMERTIHRPGEPIVARIGAPESMERIGVALSKDWSALEIAIVELREGMGSVSFPYRRDFRGALGLTAFDLAARDWYLSPMGSHPVFYPDNESLEIEIEPDRERYRPGDEVRLGFRLRGGDREVEGALGVSIVDQALWERIRADAELGSRPWGYARHIEDEEEAVGRVTRDALDRLDPAAQVPEDLDLVAEILFRNEIYYAEVAESPRRQLSPREFFSALVVEQLRPAGAALGRLYAEGRYPSSAKEILRDLRKEGTALEALSDPWGRPYRASLVPERDRMVLKVTSAGRDGRGGTRDDLVALESNWSYFDSTGRAIDRAIDRHQVGTATFVRDERALRTSLEAQGIDLDALRDPWGRLYRFEFGIRMDRFTVTGTSSGPDRRFGSPDDIHVYFKATSYFTFEAARLQDALSAHIREGNRWPLTEDELGLALSSSAIRWEALEDPWGRRYYASWTRVFRGESYAAMATRIQSAGPDGKRGTADDFEVACLSNEAAPLSTGDFPGTPDPSIPPRRGVVRGTVRDEEGGVLPGAQVVLSSDQGSPSTAVTNEAGLYTVVVPPGTYTIEITLPGFRPVTARGILVLGRVALELDATLEVAGIAETVTVAGEAPVVSTHAASVAVSEPVANLKTARARPLSTPRLREYFPETLLWEPSLETNERGEAEVSFPLADSITTWRISVMGSTADGRIGTAEREIVAFQPFFVEYDPPPVLTAGDTIWQPVVLRSYLDHPLDLDLTFRPGDGLSLLGPEALRSRVESGEFTREFFGLQARRPGEAKPSVTALGADAGDAVTKPILVRPDGREIVNTRTSLLRGNASHRLEFPKESLEGGRRAGLAIYPNLLAHVVASVDEIMKRPYGCAEQTLSSGYPSLLLSRHLTERGEMDLLDPATRARARRYVQIAYDRLLGYQEPGGGISYWGRGGSDLGLTAYAVRFLSDARAVVDVDPEVLEKAIHYLVERQGLDGRWPGTDALTAMTAWTVAPWNRESAHRALSALAPDLETIDGPYTLAVYTLAALAAGEAEAARRVIERLEALATREEDAVHWELHGSSPFHGWGRAGRIESTALAVQALGTAREKGIEIEDELLDGGVLFLLRSKDRYGTWFSTQATVRSAEALLAVLERTSSSAARVEILVDGESRFQVELTGVSRQLFDLTPFLSPSSEIEVRAGEAAGAMLELTSEHHLPWEGSVESVSENGLRLSVSFDRTEAAVGDPISCRVSAGREGSRGSGMLIAEVGLPPGAEVDRASLGAALADDRSGLFRYDVLPDRVQAYLWPWRWPSSFSFTFRPRLRMDAKSAPSTLYDYYNPDAAVIRPPTRFLVR